jgi:hypothetical protein
MTERERLISVHNYNIVHTDNINVEVVGYVCVRPREEHREI